MKRFEFDGYEVYSTDGYSHRPVAYFAHKVDADKAAARFSGYGGVSDKKVSFVVFESYEEYEAYQVDQERKAALAKLTPKERKLLGLE